MIFIRKLYATVFTNRSYRAIFVFSILYILLSLTYNVYSIDNVRYLVSALIQSQATIFAIVISLTLVGVQLSAQKYTPRLIEIFIQDRRFWSLFIFYIVSIVLGCILLYVLQENPCYITVSFYLLSAKATFCLSLVFSMLALYIALVIESLYLLKPYMKYTLNLLKPENIARKVAESMKITDIEEYGFELKSNNPLTPIYELCRNVIDTGDEEASVACARILEELFKRSYNMFVKKYPVLKGNYSVNSDKEKLKEVIRISQACQNVVELFVNVILWLFVQSINRNLYNASVALVSALGEIGATIASSGIIGKIDYILTVIHALEKINYTVEKIMAELKENYENEYLIPHEVYRLVYESMSSLGYIAIQCIRNINSTDITIVEEIIWLLRKIIDSIGETEYVEPEKEPVILSAVLETVFDITNVTVEQVIYFEETPVEKTNILNRGCINELIGIIKSQLIETIEQAINISIRYHWECSLYNALTYLWGLSLEFYKKGFNKQANLILDRLRRILVRVCDVTPSSVESIIRSMKYEVKKNILI